MFNLLIFSKIIVMKQLLLSYVQFHVWANQQFAKSLLALSNDQLDTELPGSFTSIRKTVYHLWVAEHIWNQRLALAENINYNLHLYEGRFEDAIDSWEQESKQLLAFTTIQKNDEALLHQHIYVDSKRNNHKSTIYQTVHHVCNHATFHRGQLVNYMRAVGVKKLPDTDYMTWCKLKKK
jgi:uncharacterized damage-inducible protein DinB